jgi:hypothetical protein
MRPAAQLTLPASGIARRTDAKTRAAAVTLKSVTTASTMTEMARSTAMTATAIMMLPVQEAEIPQLNLRSAMTELTMMVMVKLTVLTEETAREIQPVRKEMTVRSLSFGDGDLPTGRFPIFSIGNEKGKEYSA